MTEDEIENNKFMEKYNIYKNCLYDLPQYVKDEYKLFCPLHSVPKDTYYANNFKDFVLVIYIADCYENYKKDLIDLGWEEIPRTQNFRKFQFVKVIARQK